MTDPTPDAERTLANADVADSADRSAALWLRGALQWTTAIAAAVGAVILVIQGRGLPAALLALVAFRSAYRALAARREEKRVFARAVQTLEDQRRS